MVYCVKYIVFCLLVLLMIVEWIFQHVQTEIKNKNKNKIKQNKTKQKKKKKNRKKKNRPTDPKFWSMLYQYKNFFQALNVVLESGYSGHSLHIDTQHYFALRQFLFKKKKKKKKKKRKKKKKGCNPTNQSLRHLKTNTCIMLLYCSWGSDIAFHT